MRHDFYQVIILLVALLVYGASEKTAGAADVGVSVNLGPPPIVDAEPQAVVQVPNSQVYFVPEVNFDLFFYKGYWWCPRGSRWYRARAYDGPWRTVNRHYVPSPVFGVPHDYRNVYSRERHIPYREWCCDHHGGGMHGPGMMGPGMMHGPGM